jgi:(E)-4-hydroxy-3-methylbut-2-enyl-diphosphate synthase
MVFFHYKRRPTVDVHGISSWRKLSGCGADDDSTNTLDTEGVCPCRRIIAAGADLIRLTTQGVLEAITYGKYTRFKG